MREYKASKLRYALTSALIYSLSTIVVRVVFSVVRPDIEPLPLLVVIVGVLGSFLIMIPLTMWLLAPIVERLSVTISTNTISGPAKRGGKRIAIPLAKVDREKTRRQSFFEKLFGYRYIHSVDGETIALSGYAFSRATMKEILEQINAGTNEPQLPVP
jgi:hypothetical protein